MEIIKTLNQQVEILGLLFVTTAKMDHKSKVIADLEKFGLNGEYFYQQHYAEIEKYIETFREQKAMSEAFTLGELNDFSFFLMISMILLENPELFQNIDCFSTNEYRAKILATYVAMYEQQDKTFCAVTDIDSIISFVDQTKLNEELKWHLMKVLKEPKPYYQKLIQQVIENQSAYEKALKKVKSLKKYLERYEVAVKEEKLLKTRFFSQFNIQKIYPSIIFSGSFLVMEEVGFLGILLDQIVRGEIDRNSEKETLLLKLKALSDSSKFDVLLSIKDAPKYNLELAEEMHLNPSTMSHHMNILLVADLVKISKENGKVYYVIHQQGIEALKKSLDNFLLE
ncbi:ArsR/SmtB family transcription factor [Isobaculum melis]|uniref:Regulatory protein, arsR family n=1 Tax=Isobaculum melis TaxID=142588 RepID=A0A1H9U931_9LACT|nr:winged helix-turn-helix domain-containing protein [Isobaculum melis]SES05842.1 regulatory protein, arsR family [Isobaculum melis]